MIFTKKKATKKEGINLAVDGKNLFYRSFLGSRTNEYLVNNNINGILFFLKRLRTILRENQESLDPPYSNIVIFFDGESSGVLRSKIYPRYKARRRQQHLWDSTMANYVSHFQAQENQLKALLKKIGIMVVEDNIVEADDMIAYYSRGKKIRIVTNDSDLCGLIDENVSVYYLGENQIITNDNWPDFFDVCPRNFYTVKAICGDTTDDIEGIRGIKEKTLAKIVDLKSETTVGAVLESANKIKESRIYDRKKPQAHILALLEGNATIQRNTMLVDIKGAPFLTPSAIATIDAIGKTKINIPIFEESMRGRLGNELNQLRDSKKLFFETFHTYNKNQ